ncbi:ribosome-recycling factor [Candidatus Similichlamydia laticola]|uniref:Ribosome recycling factor n=1 Tax=Candidatus Similichlamydia laticola TaxID=2170265 RepID=A0A369K9J4_9BACT|nr:ribosome-recycling factor [Candidatus Similichlamydia laticola]RDB31261.1 Ribosome recycling factor [Candidatus Similichlamydia laticola]
MVHSELQPIEKKMEQVISFFKKEMLAIRTGRVHGNLLDHMVVETPYGSSMRIRELASCTILDHRKLCVTPFDPSVASAIAQAIEKAEMGLHSSLEGHLVYVTAPTLDEGVRKETIKQCKKKAENARLSIRGLRKEANQSLRSAELPEDRVHRLEKEVQKLTDKFCGEVDRLLQEKESELSVV